MLILPDRNLPRGKFLLPMRRLEWMGLSARQKTYGKADETTYALTARAHDGHIVWRGYFKDREDFDVFLFALFSGSLRIERELWRLPEPRWPGLPDGLAYDFVTYNLINAGTTSYNVPSDYSPSAGGGSKIHGWGGGGSGGCGWQTTTGQRADTGGSGAAYSCLNSYSMSGSVSCSVGTGGASVSRTSLGSTAGNAGNDTTFNTTALVAKAGLGGTTATGGSDATGPDGGAAASGTGDVKYSGGKAGNVTGSGFCTTGGGGAGGPNGDGGASALNSTNDGNNAGGQGGNGSGGTGGAGHSTTAGNGNPGTEVGGLYGSGGGGGSASDDPSASPNAGEGGNYGAGGGGAAGTSGTASSGAGANGAIVVEYTPVFSFVFGGNSYRQQVLVR